MKTIKIIDLLNMIANGEELPKKITYTDADLCRYVFELGFGKDYWCEELGNWLFHNWDIQKILNDEVEIIEEEKEIEKINHVFGENGYLDLDAGVELMDKINELIEAVNGMRKEK